MTTHPVIQTMVDRIAQQFNPLRILLFGSHARGTAGAGSDIDLLVVMSEVEDKRKITVEIRRALGDLQVSKSIIVTTPAEIVTRGHLVGSVLRPALLQGRLSMNAPEHHPEARCCLRYAWEYLAASTTFLGMPGRASPGLLARSAGSPERVEGSLGFERMPFRSYARSNPRARHGGSASPRATSNLTTP